MRPVRRTFGRFAVSIVGHGVINASVGLDRFPPCPPAAGMWLVEGKGNTDWAELLDDASAPTKHNAAGPASDTVQPDALDLAIDYLGSEKACYLKA